MTLKLKVLVFLLAIMVLSGGMIVFLSKKTVRTILIEEAGKRGLLKSQDLPKATASGFRAGKEHMLLPLLQKSLKQTGAVYAVALDLQGRVLAHTNVVEKGKVYDDPAAREAIRSDRPAYRPVRYQGGTVLDVSLPVWAIRQADSSEEFLLFGGKELNEKKRLGTLRIGLPLDDALETVDKISRQVILIIAGSGGMAMVFGLILMQGILGRLWVLAEGTEKISRGEYGIRIPVESKDELGNLTQSFNRMSEELAHSHDHLEAEVKARTHELESFVYTVSHDLKSPVVAMHGMASLLKSKYAAQLDDKGKHYIDRVIANSSYMEELIQGLLALSRIGRKQQCSEKVELKHVLREVLEVHRDRFTEQNVEVVVHAPLPDFLADQVHLTQLFQNLITNAAKFMGNQPRPRIEIGGNESKEWVEFFVKDNGIGIDPAYHEKIFGIFQRLQEVQTEGTGVGLSIVKKIVDLEGGKIWVESKKGEGATFFIRFPRKEPASP